MYEPNAPVTTGKDGKKVLQFENLKDYSAYLRKKNKRRSAFVEASRRGSDDEAALADFTDEFYSKQGK